MSECVGDHHQITVDPEGQPYVFLDPQAVLVAYIRLDGTYLHRFAQELMFHPPPPWGGVG